MAIPIELAVFPLCGYTHRVGSLSAPSVAIPIGLAVFPLCSYTHRVGSWGYTILNGELWLYPQSGQSFRSVAIPIQWGVVAIPTEWAVFPLCGYTHRVDSYGYTRRVSSLSALSVAIPIEWAVFPLCHSTKEEGEKEKSRAGKRGTTQCNTAKLNQPKTEWTNCWWGWQNRTALEKCTHLYDDT